MNFPNLIEPTAKYFLTATLKKCHENRVYLYYLAFNTVIFISFCIITAVILYYCHANKPTPEERYYKMIRDQEFILSKVRFLNETKQQQKASSITNLPIIELDRF